jgi:catechol 2,3-dioxygenase-like lactoylglutathione lyase family enzyme
MDATGETQGESYDVGGVVYPRPFKIRRLGHFGFNVGELDKSTDFYGRLLGFRLTDIVNLQDLGGFEQAAQMSDSRIVFLTYGTDHHALLLAHKSLGELFGDTAIGPDVTMNQITWQVGTLDEVVRADGYLRERGIEIRRTGRDMPGSNWHCYFRDTEGCTVELYYGIEQVGWDGRSKPRAMYDRRFDQKPELPQISERQEVADALGRGVDIFSGWRLEDRGDGQYVVGGVTLPRPFKITRIGPMALFVNDIDKAERFYLETLGFAKTEEVRYRGERCVFLRNGTEHHSLKLVPKSLRATLSLSAHSNCMSMGLELGSYQQLRDAVAFLKERGVRFTDAVPPELYPGIDYAAHILDPDGHCLELYCYMEQIGWDGKPRPAALRRKVAAQWPATIEPIGDTYADQTFQGPLG